VRNGIETLSVGRPGPRSASRPFGSCTWDLLRLARPPLVSRGLATAMRCRACALAIWKSSSLATVALSWDFRGAVSGRSGHQGCFAISRLGTSRGGIACHRNADLLLLLSQNQPAAVPTKLYEYLGTRIPILAFTDEASEVADMLRQVGGHYVVTSGDADNAAQVIAEAIRGRQAPVPVGTKSYFRDGPWSPDATTMCRARG